MIVRTAWLVQRFTEWFLNVHQIKMPRNKNYKSYTREFKLEVVGYYRTSNLYQTNKKYKVGNANILRWAGQEVALILSKTDSRRIKGSRKAAWPELEERLAKEIENQREKGLRVKHWWIKSRAKQLKSDMNPSHPNTLSRGWLQNFLKRYGITDRTPTSTAQKPPENKQDVIQEFHKFIRRGNAIRGAGRKQRQTSLGKWNLSTIANMDQTPMPFSCGNGKTYDKKGKKTIWVKGVRSGLEKRQCTVQLTVFADGKPRVKPMIIFKGTGKCIKKAERDAWDTRVYVAFQEKAWCDETIMKQWIDDLWAPAVRKMKGKSLLVADVHAAQKTEDVLKKLKDLGTTPALVPGGCTSLIQPLDVVFNRTFKQKCSDLFMKHMEVSKIALESHEPLIHNYVKCECFNLSHCFKCKQLFKALQLHALCPKAIVYCYIEFKLNYPKKHILF